MRWLLLLLLIALLLVLSCSQGTNPFSPVPNANLFFDQTGTTYFVVNGGQGTADSVLVSQYKAIIYNTFIDSIAPGARVAYSYLAGRDSVVATWRNPNGTYGRVKGT
jgi:hypothetical protein